MFPDQRQRAHIDPLGVALTRSGEFKPTIAPQRGDEATTGLISVVMVNARKVLRGPSLQPLGQFAMTRLEKGPVQKTFVAHHSVSGKARGVSLQ